MREWLHSLTRPEDPLLWTWVAIVGGYAVVGWWLGRRARRRDAALRPERAERTERPERAERPEPAEPAEPGVAPFDPGPG